MKIDHSMLSSVKSIMIFYMLLQGGISFGAGVQADNSTFLTYNDTQEGYSITYPEGASLLYAADGEMSELSVLTPDNSTMIQVSAVNTRDTLENITGSMSDSISFLAGGKIHGSGQEKLGDKDGFFIDYQWTSDGIPIRSYLITTVHDGKQYSVNYDNFADKYEEEKILIDSLIDSFHFIPRESTNKNYPGYSYYPGTVYDNFGIPMTDFGQNNWNSYMNYGWDGSYGYYYPSTDYNQFPSYTGYNPNNQYYQQYQQPTIMPTSQPNPSQTGYYGSDEDFEKLIRDGFDYLAKNQYKQAENKFKAAMDIDSSDFRPHYGYADVLFRGYEGKEEDALEEVKTAISYGTGSATGSQMTLMYFLKASVEKYLKKYDDALESIEYVIKNDDEEYLAGDYYFKAKVLYLANAPIEEVIEVAEKAISLDSTNEDYIEFLDKVKREAGSESSPGFVYPSVTPVPTTNASNIKYEGGNGSSIEEAVIILGANSEMEGIGAEATWISKQYGQRNIDWKKGDVALISKGGKDYDKYEVILKEGNSIIIWFDISDFFGKELF